MLRRARNTVFWPGMAGDIRQIADACEVCQSMKQKNVREPLKQHTDGNEPWQKVGLDIFQIEDKHHLVVTDYFSTFIEVDLLTTQTSARVINLLKKHFSRYGIPRMIVSDGGPQFSSQEFNDFAKDWGIIHVFSSPMHQQANGKAEAAVRSMKKLLIKTRNEGGDPYEAMLEHRNTPRQDTGLSPAEMMFNRKTRSFLPTINEQPGDPTIKAKRQARKDSVKKHYDKKSRKLPELDVGQPIFFQHLEGRDWKWGRVSNILGPSTYEVNGADGSTYRRNRVLMRPTKVLRDVRDSSPVHVAFTDEKKISPKVTTSAQKLPNGEQVTINLPDIQKDIQTPETSTLAASRPRRTIKPPVRYNDFVTNR